MALKAAVDIELFTAIGEGADTIERLARRCRASERGVRVLCDFMTVLGFLTKTDQRYQLTQEAALFLDKRSPAYVGSAADFLVSNQRTKQFADFTDIVRRGGPEEMASVPDDPQWVRFARSMAPLLAMPSQRLAELLAVKDGGRLRVLDVAAGHGFFGIAMAKANPRAWITAVDWTPVLAVASENASVAGVADRHRTIPGDALTVDLEGPYDLALITNFMHIFDTATGTGFLKRIRAVLAPKGRIAILDFVPDENRVTPPVSAGFALSMLAFTKGGDAHPFSAYQQMLAAAGFQNATLHALPPTMHHVVTALNP